MSKPTSPMLPNPVLSVRPSYGKFSWMLISVITAFVGLMFWQLLADFETALDNKRKRSYDDGQQLTSQLSLDLTLSVHEALQVLRDNALRPAPGVQSVRIIDTLRDKLPELQSIAWVSDAGLILADSSSTSNDAAYIATLPTHNDGQLYQLSLGPTADSPIYVTIRRPPGVRPEGYWVARFHPKVLNRYLEKQLTQPFLWSIQSNANNHVLIGNLPANSSRLSEIRTLPLPHSNWQVRVAFDNANAQAELIPEMAGRIVVFSLCAGLALAALMALYMEQRRLRALHAYSRRELLQADSALRAIDDRVILTDEHGRIRHINRQAAQLLNIPSGQARGQMLQELIPPLADHLDSEQNANFLLQWPNDELIFNVSRSTLDEQLSAKGLVWVLRDVTEEQRSLKVIDETRRRYQEIFEGTGSPLYVLDLSELRQYLDNNGLNDASSLEQWLKDDIDHQRETLQHLRLTETNQIGLQLFGFNTNTEAARYIKANLPLHISGFRYRVIQALAEGPQLLECEVRTQGSRGKERFLWLTLRIPENSDDLQAVTLSINDITSRKHIELALIEREQFWSDVVRAVPDTLYIHDISARRVIFSNSRLGPSLGYSKDELQALGKRAWEKILHPDDLELYQVIRNAQQVLGEGQILSFQLRWRHRDGSWHWFEIREHAMAWDVHGRVSRLLGVAKDVTAQIIASEAMSESERRYRLLAESTTDVIFSTDRDLKLNYVSSAAQTMFGRSPEWVLQHGLFGMVANPKQMADVHNLLTTVGQAIGKPALMAKMRNETPSQLFYFDYFHADGRKIPAELRMSLMWDDNDNFEGLLGVGRDISLQRRADKDMRMAATVFEHSTAAIAITDPASYIAQVNQTFTRVTGFQPDEVIDQLPTMFTPEQTSPAQSNFILKHLSSHGSWEGELWMRRKNGENYPAWVGITAVQDDEGDLVSYVYFFSDISERKASEQRIHRLAYYDILTQIPNRSLFQDRLHTALQQAKSNKAWVALMFLDLDRFKPINDSLGHAAGDQMLKEVALRLTRCVSTDDTVARMGGDEFTLLLKPNSNHQAMLNRAIHVGEQILASLSRAFVLEGREFFVTASIGIAISPQDGDESSQLMKNADTAMYHAKERGKNNFQFYQADMNARALERLELESELRHALELDQFILHYQPQFNATDQRLTGVEALLRWQHPVRGLVPPDDFIPVLEELGLVEQVGDWVLLQACWQFNDWQSRGLAVGKMSVNLSARQFNDAQLAKRFAAILHDSNMSPAALELELTESILMGNAEQTLHILADLKQLGLSLSVDDFGTGYSSLNYLKQFPIDVLKIDRSFVDGLPGGEQDAQIARAIIAMAHSLNLKVIAEGVETRAQLDFLRQHDCDEVQGFLLGRPMPAAQLESQLKAQR